MMMMMMILLTDLGVGMKILQDLKSKKRTRGDHESVKGNPIKEEDQAPIQGVRR